MDGDPYEDILTPGQPLDRYISVPRAAALLGVSTTVMHSLLDGGAIPYTVPSAHRRVLVRHVMAYKQSVSEKGQRRKRRAAYHDFLAA